MEHNTLSFMYELVCKYKYLVLIFGIEVLEGLGLRTQTSYTSSHGHFDRLLD